MQQLSLFEATGSLPSAETVQIPKVVYSASKTVKPKRGDRIKHGIVRNATQRGAYYAYWYNALSRDAEGHEKVITRKAVIRGAACGTDRGEDLRALVELWIEAGRSSDEILRLLKRLPKSSRRCRCPNWESIMSRYEDMRLDEWS